MTLDTTQQARVQRTRDRLNTANGTIPDFAKETALAGLDAASAANCSGMALDVHADLNSTAILAIAETQANVLAATPLMMLTAVKSCPAACAVKQGPPSLSWDVRELAAWLFQNPTARHALLIILVGCAAWLGSKTSLPLPIARVEPVASVLAIKTADTVTAMAKDRQAIKLEILAALKAAVGEIAAGEQAKPVTPVVSDAVR